MCRIAGFWDINANAQQATPQLLEQMRDALAYGGPDSAGSFWNDSPKIGLGHRRLSILDLSEAGHQPMQSGHLWMVFNGEVYNFKQIRHELQALGYTFRTETDTEVLLKGFEAWGLDLFPRCRGMFALAIWDTLKQELWLVRDRLGVKPLFYTYQNGLFGFASELKSLFLLPNFDKSTQPQALAAYLQYGYVPAQHCFYQGAQKLAPATALRIDRHGAISTHQYWDIQGAYTHPMQLPDSEAGILEQLEAEIRESCGLRMVADVRVGAFLSGGIDSSLVVALTQAHTNQQLDTFTIGFEDAGYDESTFAAKIAQHLGTQHQQIICTEADMLAILPKLSSMYDEPFGDSSAIPTYLVSQLAKKQVKVSLSADGGDEIFGGYTKYETALNLFPKIQRLPAWAKGLGAKILQNINPFFLEKYASKLPFLSRYKNLSNKIPKLAQALSATDLKTFFQAASVYANAPLLTSLLPDLQAIGANISPVQAAIDPQRQVSYMGLVDLCTYLEGDILTKVDRATMQQALEGREPLLDHKLVEFGLALPDHYKIRGQETKYLLRKILYKHVPPTLLERPKQGFAIPIDAWLRGQLAPELRAMTNDSLFLQKYGFAQPALEALISQFLKNSGRVNPSLVWFLFRLYAH